MDTLLCDELLQEIFHRVPPPSSVAISLVSKRWLRLLRSSTTSLSLHFPPPYTPTTITSFSTFLTQHPFLSSLSISGTGVDAVDDTVLISVAASCPNLRRLRFLTSPVSLLSLYALSNSCINLSSISISVARPFCFDWLPYFTSLKSLSLFITNSSSNTPGVNEEVKDRLIDSQLSLESLSLCGILPGDNEVSYLWRNCKDIKKLQLKKCESIGDYSSFSSFLKLLYCLQELELRTCRSIVDVVLLTLAETCTSLDSLLIYDGCSKESLLQFINQSKCSLRKLDLRLPLDLDNTHLISLSENLSFRGLVSLRLHSCCLVTGEGLKALGTAMGNELEELALINCDVVEREPGLLTTLGQNLKRLKKLDLSYNDVLLDKEIMAMLASCEFLVELKVSGCGKLSNATLGSMVKNCKNLQDVDVRFCRGIDMEGVEFLVVNGLRLREVEVEESKLSQVAKSRALFKCYGGCILIGDV